MRRTIPTTIALSALSIFATGCAGALQSISATALACPAGDVEIANDDRGWQTRSWQASCHGRTLVCSKSKDGSSCHEEKKAESAMIVTPPTVQVDLRHHWEEYVFEPCGVAAPLPGTPEERRTVATSPAGTVPVYSAAVATRDYTALLGCTASVGGSSADVAKVLDTARDGAVRGAGGTLEKETMIDVNGHPGRDVWFRTSAGVGRARVVVRGRAIVSVVLAPLSEFSPSEIRQMFDGVSVRQPNARTPRKTEGI